MKIFLIMSITFVLGALGGVIMTKIKMPRLIWYIVLGILMGPSLLNLFSMETMPEQELVNNICACLRQIALTIILSRTALSLDIKVLKSIGRPAVLMCFVPAAFEILGIVCVAPPLLHISYPEALLLGSVLAAVSPAVVGGRMIELQKQQYGIKHHVPELILAGSSCDDIFVIVLFYSFKSLVKGGAFNPLTLIKIPTSIIFGIALGIAMAALIVLLFKHVKLPKAVRVLVFFGISLGMIALEKYLCDDLLKNQAWFSISGLLGVIAMGIIVHHYTPIQAKQVGDGYNTLWSGFEVILFTLVGSLINVKDVFTTPRSAVIFGVICIALIFRTLGVFLCILKTKYTWKERAFIMISYIPKATVQASIGGILLDEAGTDIHLFEVGTLVLHAAVISILFTAICGAIAMDKTYKHLLNYEPEIISKKELTKKTKLRKNNQVSVGK